MRRADIIPGDLVARESCVVAGMVGGDLTVERGAVVTLLGMVAGDVWVKAGGTLEGTGIVGGHIRDDGGTIKFKGLSGRVRQPS